MRVTLISVLFLFCFCLSGLGQKYNPVDLKKIITLENTEKQLRIISADSMGGRETGTPGIDMAAEYIAEELRKTGVHGLTDADDFFQPVRLISGNLPASASVKIRDRTFEQGEGLLVMSGENINMSKPVVMVGFGDSLSISKKNVKGKIVIVKAGVENNRDGRTFLRETQKKRKQLQKMGAAAMIEFYHSPSTSWQFLVDFVERPRLRLMPEADEYQLPVVWVHDDGYTLWEAISKIPVLPVEINIGKRNPIEVKARNVMAMLPGSDAELKNEYIMLSAHYDHIGTHSGSNPSDSIYNGARDNGIGIVAVLSAAKALKEYKPKRSVIFAFWAAEEKGLLGSAWYANHPVIPLDKLVYNLNIDGAGYNDTTLITVVGLDRTTAEDKIIAAAKWSGLEAKPDPVPQLSLFDRSDNVNFAKKGVPAPTFSTGFTSFDQEMMKYYHQVADEADGLNFDYLLRYYRAYCQAALLIANDPIRPFWKPGDTYESAGKQLYGLD